MLEIIQSGGLIIWPIILCSVIAMAIIGERFWSLQAKKVVPKGLVAQVWKWAKEGKLDKQRLARLRNHSPLGLILVAGLVNRSHNRDMMKDAIQEASNRVIHDLEKYLNTLGTIAEITPLLGLLGTVMGMIRMFAAIGEVGLGNPMVLSSGLSEALVTTAAGLTVAIPAFIFHRYFRGVVDELVLSMEQEALKMVDVLHGEREQ
ncbi:MAG: MotA/TolQ/ExbB proton channel family protein [Candidatus Parabeggiatoa sp. nov. 3]|nr:MAG: MotA/TolQ/ExbB proton channel family protein [Gammaproteobacteria bacterium]RKZ56183.1 MAG: MotA/TolQ/ExbB proton channel family protein [Gammaproteobacteria bacterium]RKZ77834.1 MAG: MotA/TolQ/ExbB proton channel family protein [Gammaproteobacteria bacterium]